jgi:type II secretory ATPase GspE/PulE/Tfp pilus assembly ATPase PilB-like protein
MGMEPFLVASTLTLVIAQRLLRTTCSACGEFRSPKERERKYLERNHVPAIEKVFAGKGCRKCLDSGYRGRIGVYEIMQVTPEVQELITVKAPTSKIRDTALEQGMGTLFHEAMNLVRGNITTIEDVEASIG